jgi:YVTN family beta-propeller protein
VTPDGRHVYVTHINLAKMSVIDTTLNAVVGAITLATAASHVAVGRDGRHLYVSHSDSNTISVIDITVNAVVRAIELGEVYGPAGDMAVAPDGRYIYYLRENLWMPWKVSMIDTFTGELALRGRC